MNCYLLLEGGVGICSLLLEEGVSIVWYLNVRQLYLWIWFDLLQVVTLQDPCTSSVPAVPGVLRPVNLRAVVVL